MISACRLAGFFAAHAVWCVSTGETLIPMLAYTSHDDETTMERIVIADELETCVAHGKEKAERNPMEARESALLYDGRMRIGSDKIDAIIIEIRSYSDPQPQAVMAVPYTPKDSPQFRVHRPKVVTWDNCDHLDIGTAMQAFFEGVDGHEKGAEIWNDSLDESK
jgi:hypothetical protein